MAEQRHGNKQQAWGRSRKQRAHMVDCKHKQKEETGDGPRLFISKPTSSVVLLQQDLPNSALTGDQVFTYPRLWGAFKWLHICLWLFSFYSGRV